MTASTPYLTPADVNALPSRPADARLPYGAHPLQFGDLRLPTSPGPHPVAIVIHGGCWVSTYADLQNSAALADALRECGIATWNIEYRRIDHDGGGWPGTFLDVAAAVDHVRAVAVAHPLDVSRVIASGHSAGGALGLWAAARHRLLPDAVLHRTNPLALQGALVLGGPGDLQAFAPLACDACGGPVVEQLLGGTFEQVADRYVQASPSALLPFGVRQIFITGEHDAIVPRCLTDAYVAAAQAAGDDAQHIVVADAAHHEYNAPSAVTWPVVLQSVNALLRMA